MKTIHRVAIANRGEVAVRIIRACEELNLETVLLHSDADIDSRAYRLATKTICIGPAAAAESYLNISSNIDGALAAGADAIHPGFGFLSENADFAQACEKAGLIFIGPSSAAIRLLGDKISFKKLAMKAGLPIIPGYEGEDQSIDNLIAQTEKIGLPVMVKAAAGGGGRGMKLIRNQADAKDLLESAQRESLSAFGSAKIFLEKYLDHAKHIEFQIFGDCTGQVKHFFDRECSVQRRHQKIIEESLSANLSSELRREMAEVACTIATLGKYKNAGTVEFLVQDEKFYLLEVNTRLQVEHPVTEEIMGIDLVKMQILTAAEKFIFSSKDVRIPNGQSIECRIYAEDPHLNSMPSVGKIGAMIWPEGPRRRFEYGFEAGDTVTSHYDSMIAKVIVWDENRPRAIQKMIRTLEDCIIFGVHTNIPFLLEILNHPEFTKGTMTTLFIETFFANGIKSAMDVKNWPSLIYKKYLTNNSTGPTLSAENQSPWLSSWKGI